MKKAKEKVLSFVKENTWLKGVGISKYGWGNGYVCIPRSHKMFGLHYDEIERRFKINSHGGLTFSCSSKELERKSWQELPKEVLEKEYWVIGFDTAHYNDNEVNCNKEYVESETEKLRKQIERKT